jgi:hypothetical protein
MKKIFITMILILSPTLFCAERIPDHLGHFYYALGELYTPNHSIRLGYNEYEFGILNPKNVGFVKNFQQQSTYIGFGFGISPNTSTLSFFGSGGFEMTLLNIVGLRIEANVSRDIKNIGQADLLVGVTIHL